MGDIIKLGYDLSNLTPAQVVEDLAAQSIDAMVAIGYDKEGRFFFTTSEMTKAELLWLIESAKMHLLELKSCN